jgi:hypothetical protein
MAPRGVAPGLSSWFDAGVFTRKGRLERGGESSPETKNSLDEADSARKGARRADAEDSLRIRNIKAVLSAEVLGHLIDETLFGIKQFSTSGKQTMGRIQEPP